MVGQESATGRATPHMTQGPLWLARERSENVLVPTTVEFRQFADPGYRRNCRHARRAVAVRAKLVSAFPGSEKFLGDTYPGFRLLLFKLIDEHLVGGSRSNIPYKDCPVRGC